MVLKCRLSLRPYMKQPHTIDAATQRFHVEGRPYAYVSATKLRPTRLLIV